MTDIPSGYVLKFMAGKYQGGEFPVPANREIFFGRGGELDIVLVEDMVSRKHARLAVDAEGILLEDLGSTNGTFVNGERIQKAYVQEGDRILIGTNILKVMSADAVAGSVPLASQEQAAFPPAIPEVTAASVPSKADINSFPLPEALHILATKRESCVISVQHPDGDTARLFVRNGQVKNAILNGSDDFGPLKAVYRVLGWDAGEFVLGAPSNDEFMLELEENTDELLQGARKHAAAWKALLPTIPEMETMLALKRPLVPYLADLSRDELDVLQVVINNGFLQSVIDKSPFLDVKTAEIVLKLIQHNYIEG